MGMRRFTRLTHGFSKKAENHANAVSLFFFYYNFCKAHGTLTKSTEASRRLRRWLPGSPTTCGRSKNSSPR